MKLVSNSNCLSANVQEFIDTSPIPMIKAEDEEEKSSNIIKIKMRRNPASDVSETYELKIAMFNNDQPEEFLGLMKNFKI